MDLDRKQLEDEIAAAKAISSRNDLSTSERADLLKRVERIEQIKKIIVEQDAIKAAMADIGGLPDEGAVGQGMYGALKSQGFELGKRGPFVGAGKDGAWEVPFEAVMRGYKSDLIATQTGASEPLRIAASPLGIDNRHLFPHLPMTPIGLITTQVQFLRQTTRTLPAVGDMQLAIDAATSKPVTDTVAELVSAEPVWVATISNPQPTVLFAIPALRQLLDSDMSLAYRNSVDDLCLDAIDNATTNTRNQGTDTLIDSLYKASQDVVDDGFAPKLVVLGTAKAAELALTKDGNDRYYSPFAEGQPLSGLTPVVSAQAPSTKAFIVDPTAIELFRSALAFESNTATYFESNRVVARVEGLAYVAVRQGNGICELTYI